MMPTFRTIFQTQLLASLQHRWPTTAPRLPLSVVEVSLHSLATCVLKFRWATTERRRAPVVIRGRIGGN